jgi:hypothetical protein
LPAKAPSIYEFSVGTSELEKGIRAFEDGLRKNGLKPIVPIEFYGNFYSQLGGKDGTCRCKGKRYSKWEDLGGTTRRSIEVYYGVYADCPDGKGCASVEHWEHRLETVLVVSNL